MREQLVQMTEPAFAVSTRRRAFVAPAALLFVLLVGGCARFHPQPLAPEKLAADFQRRTLADAGLRTFIETNLHATLPAWPLPAWDLAHLTLAAFYFSPHLDVARAKWAVAAAARTTAGQRPNPTLAVTPAYNSTTHIPSPWLITPTLDIPIETAGKRGYRIAQATELSEAARLNMASVAWQVRAHLRQSCVSLQHARETEKILLQQRATQEQVVRRMESQLAAGAVSPFEVTQARVALDHTRLALHDAERQRDEAHAQLAAAIGIPVSALDSTALSFDELTRVPPALPPANLRRQALCNRADILSALAEYAASESALRLEVAKQYPDIHLATGYEFDQGDDKWALGLSVTLPVLSQNQGAIAEAAARRAEMAAQFNALQARVLGELDRATAAYQAALAKAATAEALLANQQKQEQAAQRRLQAGDISRLELSSAQMELNQTTLARLNALAEAQQAFGDLEEALQSPVNLPGGILNTMANPRPAQPKEVKP